MNFVQVRFQDSSGSSYRHPSDKLYTYRNRCDLVAGDYAMVDVSGQKKVVKVVSVHKTNPSAFDVNDLKWIQGAVYLDEEVLAVKLAKERLAEIRAQIIERKRALEDISVLTSAEKREYEKLLRTLRDGA